MSYNEFERKSGSAFLASIECMNDAVGKLSFLGVRIMLPSVAQTSMTASWNAKLIELSTHTVKRRVATNGQVKPCFEAEVGLDIPHGNGAVEIVVRCNDGRSLEEVS